MSGAAALAASAVTDVFREEAGPVTAALIRRFGDFDLAEESVQDALIAALETWPRGGVPLAAPVGTYLVSGSTPPTVWLRLTYTCAC